MHQSALDKMSTTLHQYITKVFTFDSSVKSTGSLIRSLDAELDTFPNQMWFPVDCKVFLITILVIITSLSVRTTARQLARYRCAKRKSWGAHLPTTVSSMLSSSRATKTMKRISFRDWRSSRSHWISLNWRSASRTPMARSSEPREVLQGQRGRLKNPAGTGGLKKKKAKMSAVLMRSREATSYLRRRRSSWAAAARMKAFYGTSRRWRHSPFLPVSALSKQTYHTSRMRPATMDLRQQTGESSRQPDENLTQTRSEPERDTRISR